MVSSPKTSAEQAAAGFFTPKTQPEKEAEFEFFSL